LGIGHVMLWTLGSAIILATYRALTEISELPAHYRSFWHSLAVVFPRQLGDIRSVCHETSAFSLDGNGGCRRLVR